MDILSRSLPSYNILSFTCPWRRNRHSKRHNRCNRLLRARVRELSFIKYNRDRNFCTFLHYNWSEHPHCFQTSPVPQLLQKANSPGLTGVSKRIKESFPELVYLLLDYWNTHSQYPGFWNLILFFLSIHMVNKIPKGSRLESARETGCVYLSIPLLVSFFRQGLFDLLEKGGRLLLVSLI